MSIEKILLSAIFDHYGFKAQCGKCIEEAQELVGALTAYLTEDEKNAESAIQAIESATKNAAWVVEELVDVSVMIKQLLPAFVTEEIAAKIEAEKLARQIIRIEGEKDDKD